MDFSHWQRHGTTPGHKADPGKCWLYLFSNCFKIKWLCSCPWHVSNINQWYSDYACKLHGALWQPQSPEPSNFCISITHYPESYRAHSRHAVLLVNDDYKNDSTESCNQLALVQIFNLPYLGRNSMFGSTVCPSLYTAHSNKHLSYSKFQKAVSILKLS